MYGVCKILVTSSRNIVVHLSTHRPCSLPCPAAHCRLCDTLPRNIQAMETARRGSGRDEAGVLIKVNVRAVFLTDVPGVYDRPPSRDGAKLIRKIFVTDEGKVQVPETDQLTHDVTGGILAKLEVSQRAFNSWSSRLTYIYLHRLRPSIITQSAAAMARTGATVYIVQAGSKGLCPSTYFFPPAV
jgi:Amino acid kinase family